MSKREGRLYDVVDKVMRQRALARHGALGLTPIGTNKPQAVDFVVFAKFLCDELHARANT